MNKYKYFIFYLYTNKTSKLHMEKFYKLNKE